MKSWRYFKCTVVKLRTGSGLEPAGGKKAESEHTTIHTGLNYCIYHFSLEVKMLIEAFSAGNFLPMETFGFKIHRCQNYPMWSKRKHLYDVLESLIFLHYLYFS